MRRRGSPPPWSSAIVGVPGTVTTDARRRDLPGRARHRRTVEAGREVDALLTPRRQRTVVESHPELGFARLLGRPCAAPKRTPEGLAERRALVSLALDRPPPGAKWDDVLDACALIPTALRVRDGGAERLGDGARDAVGLRCEIVL
jgi:predicted RNase H-like nuclease